MKQIKSSFIKLNTGLSYEAKINNKAQSIQWNYRITKSSNNHITK